MAESPLKKQPKQRGAGKRFEPGQSREVTLVPFRGTRTVYGFRQAVMGKL